MCDLYKGKKHYLFSRNKNINFQGSLYAIRYMYTQEEMRELVPFIYYTENISIEIFYDYYLNEVNVENVDIEYTMYTSDEMETAHHYF